MSIINGNPVSNNLQTRPDDKSPYFRTILFDQQTKLKNGRENKLLALGNNTGKVRLSRFQALRVITVLILVQLPYHGCPVWAGTTWQTERAMHGRKRLRLINRSNVVYVEFCINQD